MVINKCEIIMPIITVKLRVDLSIFNESATKSKAYNHVFPLHLISVWSLTFWEETVDSLMAGMSWSHYHFASADWCPAHKNSILLH